MAEPIDSVVVDAMVGAVERFPGDVALSVRREVAAAMLEAALRTGRVVPVRCSCPAGWGHVRDPKCRRHWGPLAEHTVTGAGAETVQRPPARSAGEGFHTVTEPRSPGLGYHGPGEFAQVNPGHRPESPRARDIREVRETLIGLQKVAYVQRAIEAIDRLADIAQDGLEGALDVLRVVARRCGMEISEATAGEWLEVLDALSNPKYAVRIERVP